MKKTEFKPEIIAFKKASFDLALSNYNQKIKIENQIEKWFIKNIENDLEINLKNDVVELAKDLLFTAQDNVMQLTAEKYASLKNIPLQELVSLQIEYRKYQNYNLPAETDFCISTENETQNERLKLCRNFILSFEKIKELAPAIASREMQLYKSLEGFIDYSHTQMKPAPNLQFIKR